MTARRSPAAPVLAEAWPGRQIVWGRRPGIHLVEWGPRRKTGKAVCGTQLEHCELFPAGAAAKVRVPVCTRCTRALEARRPLATVTQLAPRSARAFQRPQEAS